MSAFHRPAFCVGSSRDTKATVAGLYEGLNASPYSPAADSARVVDLSLPETGEPRNPNSKHIVGLKP